MKIKFMLLAVVLTAFGCKSGEKAETILTAQEWELKSMTEKGTVVANPKELPTLLFSDSSRISGSAGCNRFFGTYTIGEKDALSIATKGRTMMFCPDMNFEDRYMKALDEVASYSIKANELTLTNVAMQLVIVYQPVDSAKILAGADVDAHGCKASAGYTWAEVRQGCIRLFEDGVRMNSVTDTAATSSAFIVFSSDSTKAEVFLPENTVHPILDRRQLPAGGFAWNQEDDDTLNVRMADGVWIIEQRGNVLYKQEKK